MAATLAFAAEFFLVTNYQYQNVISVLTLFVFAFFVFLADGDQQALGIRLNPVQGWTPWIRLTGVVLLVISGVLLMSVMMAYLLDYPLQFSLINPVHIKQQFIRMCLVAPIQEEFLFRVIFCFAFINLLGYWPTILVNGALFAAIHFIGGNPGPDNFIAGYLLAWAYLKSETIILPLLYHSVGNFIAFLSHLGAWYYFN